VPYICLTRFGTRAIRGDEGLSLHCDGIDATAERRACVGFSLLAALRLLRLLSLCRHYSGTPTRSESLRRLGHREVPCLWSQAANKLADFAASCRRRTKLTDFRRV